MFVTAHYVSGGTEVFAVTGTDSPWAAVVNVRGYLNYSEAQVDYYTIEGVEMQYAGIGYAGQGTTVTVTSLDIYDV